MVLIKELTSSRVLFCLNYDFILFSHGLHQLLNIIGRYTIERVIDLSFKFHFSLVLCPKEPALPRNIAIAADLSASFHCLRRKLIFPCTSLFCKNVGESLSICSLTPSTERLIRNTGAQSRISSCVACI